MAQAKGSRSGDGCCASAMSFPQESGEVDCCVAAFGQLLPLSLGLPGLQ